MSLPHKTEKELHDAEDHLNLGILLSDLGDVETDPEKKKQYHREAEKEYREAIRINPDLAEAHNNLGILLSDLGDEETDPEKKKQYYQEAEKEYREAIRIKPDLAEAHFGLGLLFKNQGRYEEARAELEKAAELYEEQGQYDRAERARELLNQLSD
jgi:tetratricopeptide (TPR) repeat protein